jgi:hypothetical protein
MNLFEPKKGERIELIEMVDDPNPIEPGTKGTISKIDSIGQIHVDWDNGRTLALLPGVDKYKIIQERIKTFESFILETGEWPRYATLDYAEENPDDSDEFVSWILDLKEKIQYIIDNVNDDVQIELLDIRGFDGYQGPYGSIEISGNGRTDILKIWYAEEPEFYIENFPINRMGENENPGIKGDIWKLVKSINIVYSGETFKKFNEI